MIFAEMPLDLFGTFGGYGVVGGVAGLFLWRVISLEREKTKTAEARDVERAKHAEELLKAWREVGELVKGHTVVQAATNMATAAQTVAFNAIAEGARLQAQSLKELAAAIDRNGNVVAEAAHSHRELRDAILTKVLPT
jgi:uncharacterized protein involved in propanediol utilization